MTHGRATVDDDQVRAVTSSQALHHRFGQLFTAPMAVAFN
jgi:hypothetical protein